MTPFHQTSSVPDLDSVAAQRWRGLPRSASPWLHEEIGRRMAERLDWIKLQPQQWVSWAPVLGGLQAHRMVAQRYSEAVCHLRGHQVDLARTLLGTHHTKPRWRRWVESLTGQEAASSEPSLPADLLWANMALHVDDQPLRLLKTWLDALHTHGMLMFSCLGPDTMREIRAVYQACAWPAPAHPMTDMHDWGDMLIETGFAEPVMDMERLTLTYSNAESMLADLRAWGRNLHLQRFPGLRGRVFRSQWLKQMEAGLPRNAEGQILLTVEVIYGHAIKPVPRVKMGETTAVSLAEMKVLLKKGG